ncbi:protein TolQ [Govanella unica]|uniref:Tol-Pal system protein TolQ n=1 Tax=Govanella unica TaxID=2975056 RepID=A0A9X3Z892_9PROT|nr:protein TolQ [Govania unica]MDA5194911.1 protein TolQ [Govania unica]
MSDVVSATDLGGTMTDFSIMALFMQADIVVKAVMIVLLLASVGCWAIIVEKLRNLRTVTRKADMFEDEFWSGRSLESLYERVRNNPDHPLAMLFVAAMREWQRSVGQTSGLAKTMGLQDRISKVMRVTVTREMERLEGYMNFLATVGSTAPFVGLFGTVWGIMNSFKSIAMSHDTSLAVVAPGIAEALFATALGLVAAIPAVVAYNKISGDIGRYANRLDGFADEFGTLLSRQLDEGAH